MLSNKYPDVSQAKYLSYKAQTVAEMAKWLNKIHKKYRWREEPKLTEDLCRCIIKVWEEK